MDLKFYIHALQTDRFPKSRVKTIFTLSLFSNRYIHGLWAFGPSTSDFAYRFQK